MCQKTNILKHFFVVLNQPVPLQKAIVLGVVKQTHFTKEMFELTRNSPFLTRENVQSLGIKPPPALKAYLVPIQINRDWFIH